MKPIRAVPYIRVSTASDAQIHSFDFQEQYWRRVLTETPNTEMVGIYADMGISGSSIRKRPQFLAMMQDAREHKFDKIYTKSVSRFARNTVELLQTVRELRDLGIEVIFEKENIHTFDPTSEVFLTIAATIAENDLQVDSERQRWSIDHRIRNGWISIGPCLYGYRMTKGNELVIVPEEAEVVRRIYQMFLDGYGGMAIAKALNADGLRTALGNEWNANAILGIIDNEKFMGDTIMGKSVIVDGVQKDNTSGEYGKRYYMEDTHEGIVSKEIWHKAQEIRKQRKNPKLVGVELPVYPFTGKIECSQCHGHYHHKVNSSGKKWATDVWACKNQLRMGVAVCDCTRIKDSVLREKFVEAYNEFVTVRPQGETIALLQAEIKRLRSEESELTSLAMKHLIPETAFRDEQKHLKAKITELTDKVNDQRSKLVRESDFEIITEFDPSKVEKFITKVIMSKNVVTFVFYNGVKISKIYTNGQPGNKPGWNKHKED